MYIFTFCGREVPCLLTIYLRVMLQFYAIDRQMSMSADVGNKDSTFCSLYILGTAGRQVKPLRVGQLRLIGVKQVQLVFRR